MTAAAMLARIVALERALRPFAALAPCVAHRGPRACVASTAVADVTVADVLAARAALGD